MIARQPVVFHFYEGPLAGGGGGRLHLVQAGGLELIVARVSFYEGAEAGQGGGGSSSSDLSAAQVHGEFGIVRVHDL